MNVRALLAVVPFPSVAGADTYLSTRPLCWRMLCSSRAVGGPCSFCPFSISFSSCSMGCEENRTGRWKWERRVVCEVESLGLRWELGSWRKERLKQQS